MKIPLVSKFQEKLQTSMASAIWRVVGFLFLLALSLTTIMLAIRFFPYTASFTEKIQLLSNNYIQVKEILGGEILIEQVQFPWITEGAENNTIFVALGENAIVYMRKVNEISYRYNQAFPSGPKGAYFVYSQQIQEIQNNKFVVREIKRSLLAMIMANIIFPLMILFLLSVFIWQTQAKSLPIPKYGENESYDTVWF